MTFKKNFSLNVKRLVLSFNIIFSFLLLCICPVKYSYSYNIVLLLLFIHSVFLLILFEKIQHPFTFDLLFSITYFFTFFIYPCFIFPVAPKALFMFTYDFNYDVINKGTCLALIAFNTFLLGKQFFSTNACKEYTTSKFNYIKIINVILNLLIPLYIIIHLRYIAMPYSRNKLWFTRGVWNYITQFKNCFIYIGLAIIFYKKSNTHEKLNSREKYFLLISIVDAFFLLILGSRTIPLFFFIIIFFLYSEFVKPITYKTFFILLFCGILGLGLLGWIRLGYSTTSFTSNNSLGILNFASDLIINNRTLYVALDYTKNNGFEIITLLFPFFGIIPFSQSLFKNLLNIPSYKLNSALFFTYLQFGLKNNSERIGLGSNIVASAYLGGGILAVIILFFSIGLISKIIQKYSKNTLLTSIIFLIFLSDSVFWVRNEISQPLVDISRCLISFMIIKFLAKAGEKVK
ncbi:MAG: O-antigen polysaccharide polymerase Wzy [Treponema sp.]|nr:O-antigen polysaccharide polymerase Wzy [Treponema sp.]